MTPRHLIAATVITALGFTLAGCSDDDSDAEPHDPFTVSVSPTDEPSEAPEKKLGPVQTVRAWVKAYNKFLRTGNTEEVDALSSRACKTCEDWIEPFAKIHRDGGTIDGYQWTVVRATRDRDFSDTNLVGSAVRHEAGTTWPSADADPVTYERVTRLTLFELTKEDHRWVVTDITFPS